MRTHLITAVLLLRCASSACAQHFAPSDLRCAEGDGAVHSTLLRSDSACTSYFLCIDRSVRAHLHRTHTEHVFVIAGEAEMMLGDSTRMVRAGDVIVIPPGTPHAAKVIGEGPLQVISVQAPYFDGTDRVWLDAP